MSYHMLFAGLSRTDDRPVRDVKKFCGGEGYDERTKEGRRVVMERKDGGRWNVYSEISGFDTEIHHSSHDKRDDAARACRAETENLRKEFGGLMNMFNGSRFREAKGPDSLSLLEKVMKAEQDLDRSLRSFEYGSLEHR